MNFEEKKEFVLSFLETCTNEEFINFLRNCHIAGLITEPSEEVLNQILEFIEE